MRMQAVKCFVRTIGSIREDTFAKSGEKIALYLMFLISCSGVAIPGAFAPDTAVERRTA